MKSLSSDLTGTLIGSVTNQNSS